MRRVRLNAEARGLRLEPAPRRCWLARLRFCTAHPIARQALNPLLTDNAALAVLEATAATLLAANRLGQGLRCLALGRQLVQLLEGAEAGGEEGDSCWRRALLVAGGLAETVTAGRHYVVQEAGGVCSLDPRRARCVRTARPAGFGAVAGVPNVGEEWKSISGISGFGFQRHTGDHLRVRPAQ